MRAGDSFQIKIEGVAPRTATITIDPGETLDSLATKINAQLGSIGKAAVNYTGSAEGLKITVNAGQTIDLISGPSRFRRPGAAGHPAGRAERARHRQHQHHHAPAQHQPAPATPTYGLGLTGGFTRHAGHFHQDRRRPGALAAC